MPQNSGAPMPPPIFSVGTNLSPPILTLPHPRQGAMAFHCLLLIALMWPLVSLRANPKNKHKGAIFMTPLKAIRAFCKTCVEPKEIKDCGDELILNGTLKGKPCPFYPYRLGKGKPSVKVIRKHCLYCMNNSATFVRECQTKSCPLWPFRMGKNPNYSPQTAENFSKKGHFLGGNSPTINARHLTHR